MVSHFMNSIEQKARRFACFDASLTLHKIERMIVSDCAEMLSHYIHERLFQALVYATKRKWNQWLAYDFVAFFDLHLLTQKRVYDRKNTKFLFDILLFMSKIASTFIHAVRRRMIRESIKKRDRFRRHKNKANQNKVKHTIKQTRFRSCLRPHTPEGRSELQNIRL